MTLLELIDENTLVFSDYLFGITDEALEVECDETVEADIAAFGL